ncbi:hypothetical protein OESDEN_08933, partial [Oesophagostomum dentatum]
TSSSTSTLRSTRAKVSFVVVDSDICKIEGEGDQPASATEVREIKGDTEER